MYRSGWGVPRLGSHPRDYGLNRKRIRPAFKRSSHTEQAMLDKLRIDRNGHRYRARLRELSWLRVRILRQIAHLRSYTLLFALADVPEDHRIIESTNVSDQ
jgi:hypothetical protein